MRYVLAVFFAVMTVLVLETVISSGGPLTQLQIEEGAPTARQLAPIADPVTPTREVVALEPSPAVEPRSSLEIFLAANPGSPLSLLPPDEAAKYVPSRENFVAWNSTVTAYQDVDFEAVEYDEELAHIWKLCKEHQALRAFCVKYQDRERERWAASLPSIALENELQPALSFIRAQFGDDAEVWSAINAHSHDVIEQIRGEGGAAAVRDDVGSRWALIRALSAAGRPSFDAVGEILGGQDR